MNPRKSIILCVDDERANLKLLENILVPRGYAAVSAASGLTGQSDDGLYERLCLQAAAAEVKTKAGNVSFTVSIGTAAGNGQSTVDAMLAAADAALYQAKAAGRNRVVSSEA